MGDDIGPMTDDELRSIPDQIPSRIIYRGVEVAPDPPIFVGGFGPGTTCPGASCPCARKRAGEPDAPASPPDPGPAASEFPGRGPWVMVEAAPANSPLGLTVDDKLRLHRPDDVFAGRSTPMYDLEAGDRVHRDPKSGSIRLAPVFKGGGPS